MYRKDLSTGNQKMFYNCWCVGYVGSWCTVYPISPATCALSFWFYLERSCQALHNVSWWIYVAFLLCTPTFLLLFSGCSLSLLRNSRSYLESRVRYQAFHNYIWYLPFFPPVIQLLVNILLCSRNCSFYSKDLEKKRSWRIRSQFCRKAYAKLFISL